MTLLTTLNLNLTPFADTLLAQARDYLNKGEDDFAIILAHIACETETESALTRLIQSRGDPLLGELLLDAVGNRMHFLSNRVYDVYSALADDYPKGHPDHKIAAADWWIPWKNSRNLRNDIAHGKAKALPGQAAVAIEATSAYVKQVRDKASLAVARTQARPATCQHPS